MEKMPKSPKLKTGLTPKVLVLGASMILPNMVENAAAVQNNFKENESMKITVTNTESPQAIPKDTLVLNSITPSSDKPREESKQKENVSTKSNPTDTISVSEIHKEPTATIPTPVAPKDIKKVEVVPASIELNHKEFTDHVTTLLDSVLKGKKAKRDGEIEITGHGDSLVIEANLKAFGIKVPFSGSLKSEQGELVMKNHVIKIGWPFHDTAETALTNNVTKVLGQLKARLENQYKGIYPNGIKKLMVEGGNLKIIFNKNS